MLYVTAAPSCRSRDDQCCLCSRPIDEPHAAVLALLADGDDTVLEVATAVGYESQSSFARAFRRWMGESPSDYRQRVRTAALPAQEAAAHAADVPR